MNHILLIPSSARRYRVFFFILAKWIFWGSIIGIVMGSFSALLLNMNDFLTEQRETHPWFLFLLPLGGVFVGFLYHYLGKDSDKGNNLIYEHIEHGQGKIPLQMGPIVFISTFVTHLFGGSTGREGAAIQMGGSIAEAVVRAFRLDTTDRKILLMSGVSAGFGSAFGAPLSGTIIGMEVAAMGKMKYEALIRCFVASFVGYFVTAAWGVNYEHHIIQSIPELTAATILKIILLSIVFSFVSVLYCQLRHGVEKLVKKHLKNPMVNGFIGGVVIILLVYLVGSRDYLGRGLPMVDKAFEGTVPSFAFLAKIVFTALTMGTGFRGGEVIPLFFVGATLGNTLSPFMDFSASFLAALGLIAVFCGATNIPITCFIFSIEAFQGKGAEYFFMACLISYLFSGHHSVWPSQKMYEPKSRVLGLPSGETIENIEKMKKSYSPDSIS